MAAVRVAWTAPATAPTTTRPASAPPAASASPAPALVTPPGSAAPQVSVAAVSTPATVPPATPPVRPASYSFVMANGDGSPVRFNPCAPVHYVTDLRGAPAGASAVVAGAVARVSAATGLQFVDDGTTIELPSRARSAYQPGRYGQRWAPILIAWSLPALSDLLPGGRVVGEGISTWVQLPDGRKAYTSGEAVIDRVSTGSLAPGFGSGATLGELLMHELAHVVGLGHTADATQIMYPTLLPLGAAEYGAGDLAGLARLGVGAGCVASPGPS